MRHLPRAARTTTTIGKYLCRRPSDNQVSRYLEVDPSIHGFADAQSGVRTEKGSLRAPNNHKKTYPLLREIEVPTLDRGRSTGSCFPPTSTILGGSPSPGRVGLGDAVIRALGQLATRLSLLATEAKNHHLAQADDFQQAVSEVLDIVREIE